MKSKTGPRSFADFERELHERMMEAERDIVAGEMATQFGIPPELKMPHHSVA